MKILLLFLIKSLSLAKFSKVFVSAGTIFLSMGSYALLYGWKYAVGIVGLLLFHEMGHYLAARQKNLNVGLPMFIPFVGAWIELKEQPTNAEIDAYVAYAGPFIGTMASFALFFLGRHTDSGLIIALAQAGFVINLFNLIPLYPLDGGRITSLLSPRLWLLGVPLLVIIWMYRPSPMLIIVALLAIPHLITVWKRYPKAAENPAYHDVEASTRFEYAVLYLGLTIVLACMIQSLQKDLI